MKRGVNLGRIAQTVLVIACMVFAGVFTYKRVSDPQASFSSTITSMFNPIPAPQEVFHKDRLAILLLGIDYNYNSQDEEYSSGARSDTIMAFSLDLPTHSIHVLSVPRDMEYTYPSGHVDKINAAYSMGGPASAEHAIADFLGIPRFDRYVVLRINATKALIDAIGGIDVPVTETLNYDDTWGHLHIHFKPGVYHMNGDQAVSYSRFRHDACSDPCRIKRQQQVMRITIAKLKNDKFNDLAHIQALINVFNRNVLTDLSTTEKLSLAQAYSGFNVAALKAEQVPYTDDRDLGDVGDVLIPDDAAKTKLVQKLFLAPLALPATGSEAGELAVIDPKTIHVQVENGSGTSGLGRTAALHLQRHGFVIDGIGNAATFDHDTTEIHVVSSVPYLGERIRKELALPDAEIDVDQSATASQTPSAVTSDVTVIIGRDYLIHPNKQSGAMNVSNAQ